MKWIRHQSDSYTNLKHQQVIAQFGVEGYGLYWICLELVCQQGTHFRIKADRNWKSVLAYITRAEPKKIDAALVFFASISLIDKKALEMGDLYLPKMKDYLDSYTARVQRVYEQGTNKVRQSTPTRRNDTRRNDTIDTPSKSISYLKAIPPQDLQQLSQKYKISPRGVMSKADDLRLYCEAKGKVYKNYKAFLENAIRHDLPKLRSEYPLPVPPKKQDDIAPADRAKNEKKMAEIRQSIGGLAAKMST